MRVDVVFGASDFSIKVSGKGLTRWKVASRDGPDFAWFGHGCSGERMHL